MAILPNGLNLSQAFIGNSEVQSAWIGNTKIWERSSIPDYYLDLSSPSKYTITNNTYATGSVVDYDSKRCFAVTQSNGGYGNYATLTSTDIIANVLNYRRLEFDILTTAYGTDDCPFIQINLFSSDNIRPAIGQINWYRETTNQTYVGKDSIGQGGGIGQILSINTWYHFIVTFSLSQTQSVSSVYTITHGSTTDVSNKTVTSAIQKITTVSNYVQLRVGADSNVNATTYISNVVLRG